MKSSQQLVEETKCLIKELSVHELAKRLNENSILIDVREPDEFKQGHIQESVNFPRGVLEMRIHTHPMALNANTPIEALNCLAQFPVYLICRSGARSVLAAQSLQHMGFIEVYSIQGGYMAWQAENLPQVRC
ncbi:Rhodanese domain protein [Pseudoalteromonas luteoviolacea B = ATCC 29581]|nr:Rhodanese domain protein [Pseudoalteromonas luteoviolacea B = ATCC 29581]